MEQVPARRGCRTRSLSIRAVFSSQGVSEKEIWIVTGCSPLTLYEVQKLNLTCSTFPLTLQLGTKFIYISLFFALFLFCFLMLNSWFIFIFLVCLKWAPMMSGDWHGTIHRPSCQNPHVSSSRGWCRFHLPLWATLFAAVHEKTHMKWVDFT